MQLNVQLISEGPSRNSTAWFVSCDNLRLTVMKLVFIVSDVLLAINYKYQVMINRFSRRVEHRFDLYPTRCNGKRGSGLRGEWSIGSTYTPPDAMESEGRVFEESGA